ncbi:MAG: ParB/RepB/Spo0J family partition protein [Sphingomonadales bacterium]
MAKKSGLGKGLSALLGDGDRPVVLKEPRDKGSPSSNLPIEFLTPTPLQPRRYFDKAKMDELTQSIKEKGLILPILVRPGQKENTYEIVAGERRWRAAQKAGIHEVPVVIRDLTNQEVLELAIIENVQRADLTAIEEARGYSNLVNDFGHTQEEVATLVGKSRSHITNMIRLLTLPNDVIKLLETGKLSAGHARALIGTDDPSALAKQILAEGLNVRAIEDLAGGKKKSGGKKSGKKVKDADTRALEKKLSEGLGLRASVDHKGKGGKLVIHYKDVDQLDEVCKKLLK